MHALRHAAKSLVANNFCDYCEIQASYAIGVANPTSIFINTFESEKPINELNEIVKNEFKLNPSGIISAHSLQKPQYLKLHLWYFGREDQNFSGKK